MGEDPARVFCKLGKNQIFLWCQMDRLAMSSNRAPEQVDLHITSGYGPLVGFGAEVEQV